MLRKFVGEFLDGWKHVSRKRCLHQEKKLRNNLSEEQIDKMVADSSIASDPPSTY